ncbi:uncharacterized protein LOC130739593 [Lotus japonicus]|uniref:uncharacterized protein LOC130739593 n=1 Tax=Lotus japonicus TaxID=34305 RepID=UPI00258CFD26|nr:uncharacterized protein LOC130739593 [Lotus japonicus]
MTQDSGKKNDAGPKPVKNSHGVKFLGLKTSSSTPSRVTRSSAKIASPESSGPAKRTRSLRIKHGVKKGTWKASSVQDISEDSIPDPQVDVDPEIDVPNDEATQVINDVLETLANAATAQDVTPDVESQEDCGSNSNSEGNSHECDAEKGDVSDVASHESSKEESDNEELIKKATASAGKKATASASKNDADRKKKKKKGSGAQTPKSPKASQISVSEKKEKKEKKEEKIAVSNGRKRKHVSETDSEPDVEPDVPDISTTAKKRVKGKRIPLNVPDAPMDNVSFHSAEFSQRWKFGIHCVPSDCDNEDSAEYRKVFVRGKGIAFSPEVINTYLGRSPDAVTEEEPDLDRAANTLTGKLVKKWPNKGVLPSGKLTAKYVVLYKIGTTNWMTTQHLSRVTPPLAKMLYLIGKGGEFDFGNLVYEQTLKHASSFAVKLPILFPCLLSGLILHQHSTILRADKPLGKKPQPLKFNYRMFTGPHVPDIMISASRGTASASDTKPPGSRKEDIVAELQEVSKTLQNTIQACRVRKLNVDQLIKALTEVPAAVEEEEVEEEAENAEDENTVVEEEAQYETVGEEESGSDKEEEESDGAGKEDVTGSTSSSTSSASLCYFMVLLFWMYLLKTTSLMVYNNSTIFTLWLAIMVHSTLSDVHSDLPCVFEYYYFWMCIDVVDNYV